MKRCSTLTAKLLSFRIVSLTFRTFDCQWNPLSCRQNNNKKYKKCQIEWNYVVTDSGTKLGRLLVTEGDSGIGESGFYGLITDCQQRDEKRE
jgi:hypothetical protein